MSAPTLLALASHVALRHPDDYPAGTCVAWMDAADRVCGKPATYLCARHEKAARARVEKAVERENARRAKAQAAAPARRVALAAELEEVEARLNRIDPLRRESTTDGAVVNTPLATRLPSDSRIAELAQLHERRERLARDLAAVSA
ncbi:hypothetical protein [Nocardioides alkalitolerans]|uniref:hypothetical protein n=1 Tax=Nocardioides alkalitolerans TaxID=281714 RepID=UPI00041A803E|nr:hypothetical protein [Nocardioides alkalitolerans]